jgi:hypothetical protein
MKRIVSVVLWCALVSFVASAVTAGAPDPEINAILNSADGLFRAMRGKEYKRIWHYLSEDSRKDIVNDTYKAIRKYNASVGVKVEHPRELIEDDFLAGGSVAKSYWDGYLTSFSPDMALEESRWEMGPIGEKKAEILIQHKRAELPARIRMFKEGGEWRVGLVETFKHSKR